MKKLFNLIFDKNSKKQFAVFLALLVLTTLFSFFICAVSIENDWVYPYPLPGSVDDYGCYPQMFDSFQKGRLDIDTDYDLSVISSLENPYDTGARRAATGDRYGVYWDRALYDGKLYSYFGVAPVIFLYYPFYFLTGRVLSDALTAAILSAISAVALMLLLRELISRLPYKVPYFLFLAGCAALPFGSLIWSTQTCANFYHIAVQAGICSVAMAFLFLVHADKSSGWQRKLLFALAGICSACVPASRPNHVFYLIAALPTIVCIIVKRPNGTKSTVFDVLSFAVPAAFIGVLLMIYNYARFGSPFDFGNNYQLTLWDMSQMSFSFAYIIPALFHYFGHPPIINGAFPFLHPSSVRLSHYAAGKPTYISGSVGALWFPCVYGLLYLPAALEQTGRKAKYSALAAAAAVVIIAVTNMSYAGVHLRYQADIMYVLAFGGVFGFISAVGKLRSVGKNRFAVCMYVAAVIAFLLTITVDTALIFDNERDMIMNFHPGFYNAIKGLFQ